MHAHGPLAHARGRCADRAEPRRPRLGRGRCDGPRNARPLGQGDDRSVRPARHPRQQCRRRRQRRLPQLRRREARQDHGHQPDRAVPHRALGRETDAGAGRGRDPERRLDLGLRRQRSPETSGLQLVQGGDPPDDQGHGLRVCRPQHPRERDRAGLRRHRRDAVRARKCRMEAHLDREPAHGPLRPARGNGQLRPLSLLARRELRDGRGSGGGRRLHHAPTGG